MNTSYRFVNHNNVLNMKRIILTLIIVFSVVYGWAQGGSADSDKSKKVERVLHIYTAVKDHITHEAMDSTLTAILLNADSTFADSAKVEDSGVDAIIKSPGKYILKIDADGYQTKYVDVDIHKLYKKEVAQYLKPSYMRRLPRKNEYVLDDVVIKATKLKFYMDGDTLVYNADAFNLAEGSMLDALIKKLPGVELNRGGEIKVNGRKVDALLLNGKDFFNSDRELMLENLPTYMVKKIQAYERIPESVRGTNMEEIAEKELVMNVKLKKEYSKGWIANAEVGGGLPMHGTDSKFENAHDALFLGRLFGLRFTEKSALSIYAKANNVNDDLSPNYRGNWAAVTQSQGLTTRYETGANYQSGSYEDGYEYTGSVKTSYSDKNDANHTANETFLEGGNTFGRNFFEKRSYDFEFGSRHDLELHTREPTNWYKNIRFQICPSFNYLKWNNHSTSASTTLSADVASGLGKAWMDSIAAPNAGELLRKYAINRTISQTKGTGHTTSANVEGNLVFSPAHNDYLGIGLTFIYNHTDRKQNDYEHYKLDNPMNSVTSDLFQNKYNPTFYQTNKYHVGSYCTYIMDEKAKHVLTLQYFFLYNYEYSNYSLYLLNKLKEWGDSTNHTLGTLPSTAEMLTTLDAYNCNHSRTSAFNHGPDLSYHRIWRNEETGASTDLTARLSMQMNHESLDYWRGNQIDTIVGRNTAFLSPSISVSHNDWNRNRSILFVYNFGTSAPPMPILLNVTDTSNPLYVTHGNPNLKNITTHYFNANYSDKFKRVFFDATATVNILQNDVASGFIYNKSTGVRTVTPENVNGNWNLYSSTGINFPLGKSEKWWLKDNASYNFTNSVDLSGVDNDTVATRSVVKTHNIADGLELSFRPDDRMEFSAKGNINYQHSTSPRMGFNTIDAFTFNYGVTAQIELPWNMQLATDITMYSRRGYSDESMNTNELVWNARLTKRLMHGNLLIQLDGFDLLGNLSNVTRYIDAQGKTETFYNVIPSYALLHVAWRLNKEPNRR